MFKLVYDVPVYHGTIYASAYESSLDLQNVTAEIARHYPEIYGFSEEVFSRLYGNNKQKRQDTPYWYRWAEDLHECLDQIDIGSLVDKVDRDPVRATLATTEILTSIRDKLPDIKLEDIEKLEDAHDGLEQLKKENPDKDISGLQGKLEKKTERAKKKAGEVEIDKDEVRAAIRQATTDVSDSLEIMQAFGQTAGTDADKLKHDSVREYKRMAKKLQYDKRLLKFVDLVGNLRNSYTKEKQNMEVYSRSETSDVVLGSDISRVLLSEFMNEDMFDMKYINDELLMRDVRAKENRNKGDVVMCIDFSGSMQYMDRYIIAQAAAVAMYHEMQKEKRRFSACLFNGRVIYEMSHDRGNIFEFIEFTPSGGTVLEPALRWAQGVVTPESDVVIITDGFYELKDIDFWRKGMKTSSILGICIGGEGEDALRQLCSKVIVTGDLLDTTEDMFRFLQ